MQSLIIVASDYLRCHVPELLTQYCLPHRVRLPLAVRYDRMVCVRVLTVLVTGIGGGKLQIQMARVVFMGTPRFGQIVLDGMAGSHDIVAVVTQPDRKAGRGRRVTISPVKAWALEHGCLVLQPPTLRGEGIAQRLADLAPAAIVVAAFGQILPPHILTLPEYNCINVHASLLPRHRGAAPIPAAILAGDERTGVTIMLMDDGVDTGPILSQSSVDIAPEDTTASLAEKLGYLGATLLVDTLPRWLAGDILPQKQDHGRVTYAGLLCREDGRIDWTESAAQIARRCRAFYPWPGTFGSWGEQELKVLRARPLPSALSAPPGKVMQIDSEVMVATGNGLLVLEEVQLAGKRPMLADVFVRGQHGFVGSTLH